MKKILFYLCGIYNGGTEIETLNLMKNLSKEGYELLYYYHDKQNSYDVMVQEYNHYANYIDIKNKVNVDTVIYCTHALDDIDLINNIEYKHSYFWFHYFWDDQEKFLEIGLKRNYIDKVITVSKYAQKKIQAMPWLKNRKNDVEFIFNILDENEIIEKSKQKIPLERVNGLNLVTVARFAPIKGYHRVKQMIDILIQENINFKWYIVGKGNGEKEHNEVVEMLKGYDKNVELVGHKSNPLPYVKNADYLVLMSDRETSGLVITEAKIIGTPCIVSNFEASYEQITDGENGFIIDRNNVNEFRSRLPEVLQSTEKMRKNLSNFKYSKKDILKKWKELL